MPICNTSSAFTLCCLANDSRLWTILPSQRRTGADHRLDASGKQLLADCQDAEDICVIVAAFLAHNEMMGTQSNVIQFVSVHVLSTVRSSITA